MNVTNTFLQCILWWSYYYYPKICSISDRLFIILLVTKKLLSDTILVTSLFLFSLSSFHLLFLLSHAKQNLKLIIFFKKGQFLSISQDLDLLGNDLRVLCILVLIIAMSLPRMWPESNLWQSSSCPLPVTGEMTFSTKIATSSAKISWIPE